ncbi:purine-cytosine permease family protein [Geodermatophilus ruber]|uniref:Purine-cytosine permease n=1 Tax=Geodermatophilus ruber TaxID=504800 RepID=A0A1I4DZE7_9ACTN|nr:cytosine permease [Geodermatophilus ruber]SFK98363.1 Purine-cytosine permease [Geodermatophilus ruber]
MVNAVEGVDEVGRIETRGIDHIPENERHSTPRNLFTVLSGAQLCFALFVFGWLPIVYGLGWWSAVSAITVGLLIGSLLLGLVSLLGPGTGTNTAVSSGAVFGVLGRLVGSLVALFIAIGAYALTIWTGGQAVAASAERLFGWGGGDVGLAISYLLPAVVTIVMAIYGHANLVRVHKVVAPSMAVLIVVGFVVLGPQFDASYQGGAYILGSFGPTWVLAMLTALAAPLSYAPFVNDYSRYISERRFSRRRIATAGGVGIFVGLWIALIFGAYAASIFTDPSTDFTLGLVGISPTWYVLPLLVIGLFGTVGQGSMAIYGTGLDTSSLFPRLSRVPATVIVSAAGLALVYLGSFVWNALPLVSTFISLLSIITAPWVAIMLIGYFRNRGEYTPEDLQVFTERRRGGRYWYSGGWNPVAMVAWSIAVVVGLLFSANSIYVGAWSQVAGGVDLSFISSLALGGLIYGVAVAVDPGVAAVRRPRPVDSSHPPVPGSAGDALPTPPLEGSTP